MNKKVISVLAILTLYIAVIFLSAKNILLNFYFTNSTIFIIITIYVPFLFSLINCKNKKKILALFIIASILFFLLIISKKNTTIEEKEYISPNGKNIVIVHKYEASFQKGIKLFKKQSFYYKPYNNVDLFVPNNSGLLLNDPVGNIEWIDDNSFKILFWRYNDNKKQYILSEFTITDMDTYNYHNP